MIYEQLLHDFVDGSLDYEGESSLFTELQANEGLRGELKMLMLMQRAVTHDMPAFSPAADSHDAIFRRLGFATGIEETSSHMAYGVRHGLLGKYLQGIIGGVIGAMVMAFLLTGVDHGSRESGVRSRESRGGSRTSEVGSRTSEVGSRTSRGGGGESIAERLGDMNGNVPPVDGAARNGAAGNGAAPVRAMASLAASSRHGSSARRSGMRGGRGAEDAASVRRERSAPRTVIENHDGSSTEAASDTAGDAIAHSRPRVSFPAADLRDAAIGAPPSEDAMALSSLHDLKVTEILPLSVEYRTLVSRNFAQRPEALVNSSDALLRDKALAVHYLIGDGRGMGIEIGQEEFYQRFEEHVANGGDVILHEQNPVLFWGGASVRQVFRESSDLRPYAQLTVGGTRVGPMGRVLLGASFDIVPELQVIGGGEMSAVAYTFGGRWYLSPKYAMTYGISLRF